MNKSFFKGVLVGAFLSSFTILLVYVVFSVLSYRNVPEQIKTDEMKGLSELTENEQFKTKFGNIVDLINKYYIDEEGIDPDKAADGILDGLVASLGDKYADYYPTDEFEKFTQKYEGRYGGLGAYVSQNSETREIVIVNPFENSPAEKAGIEPGDVILEIGGESVEGKELDYAVGLMKGEAGTKITLKLRREKKEFEVEVTREIIDVPTVAHKVLDGEKIGYIYIATFDEVTVKQFDEAVTDLESKGCEGLIIDIRDNGGGRLDVVIDMANRILSDGMIMYTETKKGIDERFMADNAQSYDKPMVVLINQYSASSSEVFAGAMQDREKAVIVGTTSYGKGVVQSIFPLTDLNDGSGLKLTTARYYTPNGRNIDGVGIKPDVEVEYDKDKSVKVGSENRDNQIVEAIKTLKDKIGG